MNPPGKFLKYNHIKISQILLSKKLIKQIWKILIGGKLRGIHNAVKVI